MTMIHKGLVSIVMEGRRLQWRRTAAGFELAGLWPDGDERQAIARHLDDGTPMVIVLEYQTSTLSALVEECRSLPEGVSVVHQAGGVVDLEVRELDWLPHPLRQRGLDFQARARAIAFSTPVHLLPPLIVEEDPSIPSAVRFVLRTRASQPSLSCLLDALVTDLRDVPSSAA